MRWITLAGVMALATTAGAAGAQGRATDEPGVCYGFAFGAFRPALDWRGAGHPETAVSPGATPEGRQWAVNAEGSDSLLVLFPGWWPAGVTVAFARPPRVPGDTVAGRAVALVADGRRTPPSAPVRAWVVPCGRR